MRDFKASYLNPLSKTYSLKNIATMDIETERWLDYDELKDIDPEKLKKDWHNHPLPLF